MMHYNFKASHPTLVQSKRKGGKSHQSGNKTNCDDTLLWQVWQVDLTVADGGTRLALTGFTAAGDVTYALLYIPLYFKHIPLSSVCRAHGHWLS